MPLRRLLVRSVLLGALAVAAASGARAECFRSAVVAGTGLWSLPATWEVNTASDCSGTYGATLTYPGDAGRTADVVEIVNGDAVGLNVDVTVATLTVSSGRLSFDNGGNRSLTVTGDVTVEGGGTLEVPTAGGAAAHDLEIGGSLANDGVFDMRGGATQSCEVLFSQDGSPTVSGIGTTTLDRVVVDLGGVAGPLANTLDVQAVVTTGSQGGNIVAIVNGTLRVSSASTITASALTDYTLDNNAGLTVADAGATVTFSAALTSSGAITVSAGTLSVGQEFVQATGADDVEALTISGGTVRVATAGAAGDASTPTVGIADGTSFTMSSGALVIENGNANGTDAARALRSLATAGRFSATGGTITLGSGGGTAGTFRVEIAEGSLPSLTVDTDGAEARAVSDLALTGDLAQTSGSLVMDAADDLFTSDDPAGLGAPVTSQTIADTGAGWAMLGPPRSGMTVADLKDQNLTSGFPGSHYPSAGTNLLLGWDGAAWEVPTGAADALASGEGFVWYFFDDQSPVSENVLLPFTLDATCGGGACASADDDLTVALNAADEYTLLGNPYGHAITFTDLVGTGADVPNVGSIWDDAAGSPDAGDAGSTTGSYVLTTANDDRVGVWQGVFLDNPEGATAVTIPDLAKTDAATTFYRRAPRRLLQLTLAGYDAATETRTWDEAAVLYFAPDATDGWDAWDASKLTPLAGTFATLAFVGTRNGETELKSQESRPFELAAPLEVPLAVTRQGMGGTFELRWPGLDALPETWALTLVDAETGAEVDLRAEEAYTFAPATPGRPARHALSATPRRLKDDTPARFVLRITPDGATARDDPASAPTLALDPAFPNPFRDATALRFRLSAPGAVRLAVFDVLGREVAVLAEGELPAGVHLARWDAAGAASGVYVVRLDAGGRAATRTVTLQR